MPEIILQVSNDVFEIYTTGVIFKDYNIAQYVEEVREAVNGTLPPVQIIVNSQFPDDSYCIEIGAEYVWGKESQKKFYDTLYETWHRYANMPIIMESSEYKNVLTALYSSIGSVYDIADINRNIHMLWAVYWTAENTCGSESKQIQLLLTLGSFMFYDRRYYEGKRCIEKAFSLATSQDFYSPIWKYYSHRAYAFSLAAFDLDYCKAIQNLQEAIHIACNWGVIEFQIDATLEMLNILMLNGFYDHSLDIVKDLKAHIEKQSNYSNLYNALLRLENQLLHKKIEEITMEYYDLSREYDSIRKNFFTKLGESVIFCVKKVGPSVLSYAIGACFSGDAIINSTTSFSNSKIRKVVVNNG